MTPRAFHAFIVASTLIVIAGALVVTRTTGSVGVGFGTLDAVALLMGGSTLAITFLVRQRLPGRGPGQSGEDWWRQHLGRAVLIWAFLEMPAVVGAVTLMATRHVPVFALLGIVALAGLLSSGPGRLGG
jgi:hypothetical protein